MRTLRRQQGFTLVEVLVSMVLTVVVFGATLTVLSAYTTQTQGSMKRNDAQNQARVAIDRIVRQLRNIASPVASPKLLERAAPYDIVFQTVGSPNGSNASGAQRVMYCLPQDSNPGSSSTEVMYSETQTWTTATPPPSPWSSDPSMTIQCPDPLSALPPGVGQPVIVASAVTNRYQGRTDRPAFTYGNGPTPSDLSKIFTVQIGPFVNPTPDLPPAETELHSAAFLRNQPRAPVVNFTYTPTGGGGVLLNAETSYSPDGQNLAFSWSCSSPSPCPQAGALAGWGSGLADWKPGAGTYTVSVVVTDQTGLIATTTQQVTLS
jgi:prepilin-type N-terminal cleavage/methylation domain-containing protein